MAGLDEDTEIVGRAEAARRREEADRLIAPGAIEGIFGDRHQLEMGEAHVADIRHELIGKLAIGEIAVALLGTAPP